MPETKKTVEKTEVKEKPPVEKKVVEKTTTEKPASGTAEGESSEE